MGKRSRWGEGRSKRKEIGAAESVGEHTAHSSAHTSHNRYFPSPVVFVYGFLVKVDTQAFHE